MHSFGRQSNDVRIVVICESYFASIYVNIVTCGVVLAIAFVGRFAAHMP